MLSKETENSVSGAVLFNFMTKYTNNQFVFRVNNVAKQQSEAERNPAVIKSRAVLTLD